MENTEQDPVSKVAELTAEMRRLERQTYWQLFKLIGKWSLKVYLTIGFFAVLGALLLRPIWVACKWLWNLYG